MSGRAYWLEDFVPGVTHVSPPHTMTEAEAIDFAQETSLLLALDRHPAGGDAPRRLEVVR